MPAPPRAAPFASAPRAPGVRISRSLCPPRSRPASPRPVRSTPALPRTLRARAPCVSSPASPVRASRRDARLAPDVRASVVRAPRARRCIRTPCALCARVPHLVPRTSYPARSMLAFPAPLALAPPHRPRSRSGLRAPVVRTLRVRAPIVRACAPGFALRCRRRLAARKSRSDGTDLRFGTVRGSLGRRIAPRCAKKPQVAIARQDPRRSLRLRIPYQTANQCHSGPKKWQWRLGRSRQAS